MATEPVLGVPQVQPSLLDDLSFAARRCASRTSPRRGSHGSGRQAGPRRMMLDDEDDEVFDDEDFDENSDSEDSDEDSDENDDEEEETWQVSSALTS